ncbi:hypothetical protein [Pseudomonas sp. EA_105y_Pfl2_R69]|jgi:hypothetical protein|uniref:hypothetical protein n=1 Tax=Pseudomonas sp. EA_105y_Pfl2_R69 TaxID=3088683 RepID=UPI0030DA981D
MFSLSALFAPARPLRAFALLNGQGICRALRQSAQVPLGAGWIEVTQVNLSWLNQPLPGSAIIPPIRVRARPRAALPA